MDCAKRTYILLSALVTWIALWRQLHFFMHWAEAHDFGTFGALWSFMSFFTNLSNLLAGVTLLIAFFSPGPTTSRRGAVWCAAVMLYLCITAIIFNLELSHTLQEGSPVYLLNMVLHYLTPVLYMGFWIFYVSAGKLEINHVLWWLVFPSVYFGQVMLRGLLIGHYPYAFFDVKLLGYEKVLLNGLQILVGFMLVGGLIVAADRLKMRLIRG